MADRSAFPLAWNEVLWLHRPRTLRITAPSNLCQAHRCQVMPPPVCMRISWIAREAPDFCACPALSPATPPPQARSLLLVLQEKCRHLPLQQALVPGLSFLSPRCTSQKSRIKSCFQIQFWSLTSLGSKSAPAPYRLCNLHQGT